MFDKQASAASGTVPASAASVQRQDVTHQMFDQSGFSWSNLWYFWTFLVVKYNSHANTILLQTLHTQSVDVFHRNYISWITLSWVTMSWLIVGLHFNLKGMHVGWVSICILFWFTSAMHWYLELQHQSAKHMYDFPICPLTLFTGFSRNGSILIRGLVQQHEQGNG